MQLELDIIDNPTDKEPIAANVPIGHCFLRKNETLMRVKPTSYLLNSSLVSDALAASKVLVCNIEKGTVFFIKGDDEVEEVNVVARIRK